MPMHQDLTGRTFGKLKVLKRLDEKQDRYYVWLCQCECGNTTKVNTRRLTRGTVTDCGCTEKKTARNGSIAEDLTGPKTRTAEPVGCAGATAEERKSWRPMN